MREKTPYLIHVFVCSNDRKGERASCADHDSPRIKSELKEFIAEKGWKGRGRVSTSGCLGLCGSGPNVIIYPHSILFSEVDSNDLSEIKSEMEALMDTYRT